MEECHKQGLGGMGCENSSTVLIGVTKIFNHQELYCPYIWCSKNTVWQKLSQLELQKFLLQHLDFFSAVQVRS